MTHINVTFPPLKFWREGVNGERQRVERSEERTEPHPPHVFRRRDEMEGGTHVKNGEEM